MQQKSPWYYLDSGDIKQAFAQAAKTYDSHAVMQQLIGKHLIARVNLIKQKPQTILNVGSATGTFANLVKQIFPKSNIIQLDLTQAMLQFAKLKSKSDYLINANSEAIPLADDSIDMIVSNLMLHWSNHPKLVIREWQRVLKPDGALFFTTLGHDTLKELKHASDANDNLPHIHHFFDMHDVGDWLTQARFSDPVMDTQHYTISYKSVIDLLIDLKKTGCHNIVAGRRKTLTGRRRLKQIIDRYEKKPDSYPATYEVIFGHAWGTQTLTTSFQDDAGDASFSIKQLRRLLHQDPKRKLK